MLLVSKLMSTRLVTQVVKNELPIHTRDYVSKSLFFNIACINK